MHNKTNTNTNQQLTGKLEKSASNITNENCAFVVLNSHSDILLTPCWDGGWASRCCCNCPLPSSTLFGGAPLSKVTIHMLVGVEITGRTSKVATTNRIQIAPSKTRCNWLKNLVVVLCMFVVRPLLGENTRQTNDPSNT